MQGIFPSKAYASVTTSQVTVSSSPSPPESSSKTLTTPELDQSPVLGSPSSSGSVRKNKRPPPVKIPQSRYSPPIPPHQTFSHGPIVSEEPNEPSEDEDIPIYFGDLPAHLSGRRPSPGIPLDASYEHCGFLSSRSSSFGNCLPTSPLPKLSAGLAESGSYRHPLEELEYTKDTTIIKGFYGPINPFAASAPTTCKINPLVAVTPPVEAIGLGLLSSHSRNRPPPRDITSISLDKGYDKTLRGLPQGGLSVPASLQTSKLRREIGGLGHVRSNSNDSTFTVSAYEGLPSDTPQQNNVSRFGSQLGDDQTLLARSHMRLTDQISPKSVCPPPPPYPEQEQRSRTKTEPTPTSPPSSTHAEAGFFLSQMDSYLAQHAENHHPFRAQIRVPQFGSYEAPSRSEKPTLMLDTSCLLPSKQAQSATDPTTNRRISHLRNNSGPGQTASASALASASAWTPLRREFDQSTTIQLHIDQENYRTQQPIFKYTRTRSAKAFQARPNGRPHTAGSVTDTGKQPFAETGCVEFRMEKKELWPYHYSALEPLPTVRRILINGDVKHNYIKRRVSLGLRTNGVYQVFGTHEKGEVEWKFEYVVEDRRSEATGKAISGERVIMPLTFSCTPDFLDSNPAMRTGFVGKVRRTVTPPVFATRVPPPSLSAVSSDQSPSRTGRKTPLFSFSRTDSSVSTDQNSPASQHHDSPQDTTRPLRSKISASLLPFGSKSKRPSTAQPHMPSSPLSPLATSVSVSSISPGRKLSSNSDTKSNLGSRSAETSFISLDTGVTPLLPSQKSAGFIARWTPKSILKKRPATAAGHH